MPETALKNVPAPTGRFGLTKRALLRLWRNAIKDDDKLVDEAIQDRLRCRSTVSAAKS